MTQKQSFFSSSLLVVFLMSTNGFASEKLEISCVQSPDAPAPIGPFSQAINVQHQKGLLFISGQLPIEPKTNELVDNPEAATLQVMTNLRAILETAGLSFDNVVKTTILLRDMTDFPVVNQAYSSFLKTPYPARETFQAAALPKGARLEISMIAAY